MPLEKNQKLQFFIPDFESDIQIAYSHEMVSAGFPSPANDFLETKIDLNKELSKNPLATFYVKVKGDSMINSGINDKDVLIVDRSLEPNDNKIAVCFIDGEFTVKRIKLDKNCLYLMPENKNYQPIKITEDNQFVIWGIVTYVIKAV
ncbi:MAG TPA: translesion error-prone DNA polymerase V autoproteolytic subunit [Flavobacterium sp.]|jgi:DNA polymerase V|uniref:LexA family protein n=1 Tax=Flavobacterium sp. TaxID=239 RepID=UPI002BD3016D|nr:translesion error-prone DNA polymerase V autoproteolytic subunit [Flavobacterium sp.]MCA0348578.1 translesion error-prone DNA polymerase V autoproteolytic subunit [Bacteroidota bacterium]HPW97061.1 translesion error-prone DNA polymerase V autoproteolytic subunit [Flavobacterium sp.]HQA73259.1 translesion error-prone DNA polymerase V autoproteolytic subunit [Flavobacterium sp.]